MEMFALDDEVARLEAALSKRTGTERLGVLTSLAWHLRQRSTCRATDLVAQAQALLPESSLTTFEQEAVAARLLLVQSEIKWLFAEHAEAEDLAERALTTFTRQDDPIGCADAHALRSWIAGDRGGAQRGDADMLLAVEDARRGGDLQRVDITETVLAFRAALRDVDAAQAQWGHRFHDNMPDLHPAVQAFVSDFLGAIASLSSDFGKAAAYLMRAYECALISGQLRTAIKAAVNAGDAFSSLNDHQAALEWMQRGLDLARTTRWPMSIAVCLTQAAEVLRHLGRREAAQELLDEALLIYAPLGGSRNHTIALEHLGDLALDRGDYSSALHSFQQLQQQADALQQPDFQATAWRGQAHALLQLGRLHEALEAAAAALTLAQTKHDSYSHIEALKVMAEIHTQQRLPAPDGMQTANAALHYLAQAQVVAAGIEGYTVSGDLLDAIANAHAMAGDYRSAFEYTHRANAAREKTHSTEATNRAIAMQVRHQTERAQADSEHHRQLAQAEARRAEVLQQTSATLAHLGAVGQEITAHLAAAAVFKALNRHVHGLLDVSSFAIYLVDTDGLALQMAFGMEMGQPLPPTRVEISDPLASSARCLRERREILMDVAPAGHAPNIIPGTLSSMSRLFAPLAIGERILGVMTVQALRRHAYGERERLIFRTLCAYGAIALDNANAYHQLELAQAQLVAQEKLAALGSLVAGVAHELNTPIGNSLLMASALQEKTDAVDLKMAATSLQQSDLRAFLADAQEASTVIIRGLTSAADLVNSFKQVAVDRTTAHRRVFDLQQTSHEVVATMMNQIKISGHSIELDLPADIAMHSYPGPFGQVIANLIVNALLHAFTGREQGLMRLSASQPTAGRVQIEFRDNGNGIPPQNLSRIFDPFFTTRMGQGGSGLGLSISYNIVTSILNGHITVQSTTASAASGTCFTLDLPLSVMILL
jgi:signal transduction histidine kinase